MAKTLRVYYDFSSPFCYVARAITARLVREHAVQVDWQPFEVIDYLPPQGAMPQNPAFVRRGEAAQVQKLAEHYGLTIHLRERLLNSNLALCAVEHARELEAPGEPGGLLDRVHGALFDAFYRDQRDIGRPEVVVEIAGSVGCSSGLAAALADGRYRQRVAASRQDAHGMGIVAVPTFLAGGFGVVGIPGYAAFEQLLEQASAAHSSAKEPSGAPAVRS